MSASPLRGLVALQVSANLFFVEALQALARNKLRSTLATLGIMIAVAAVVCAVAIGEAGSERAEAQLYNLGDNLVWVEAGSRNVNGVRSGTHGMTNLTYEDAEAILREVPLIKSVSPQVDVTVQVVYGNRNWATRGRGITPEYLDIRRWTLAEGNPFTTENVEQLANVCLIGQTVRERLFGAEDAVGQLIRVQNMAFVVAGVLAPKGQSSTGQDQDDTLFLPYTTALRKLRGNNSTWVDDIMCSAVSPQAVNPAATSITALLRQRHHIGIEQEDDFNIRRPDELIKAEIEASRSLTLFLISIASISLLVGGIGIMNVMLVSVAQRTREIGLRLAVGAKEAHVQAQFLGEAMMLSLLGGFLGLITGTAGSFVLGHFLGWTTRVPLEAVLIAPAFSIAVGIFSGFYPAWRAARLDPVLALRYE